MIRWEQGRAEIDELLHQAKLQRVAANPDPVDQYLVPHNQADTVNTIGLFYSKMQLSE
jgi:hypothetical protein